MADNPTQPGVYTQQEQLQAKHVGTGHPEMTHQYVAIFWLLLSDIGGISHH